MEENNDEDDMVRAVQTRSGSTSAAYCPINKLNCLREEAVYGALMQHFPSAMMSEVGINSMGS